MDMRDASVNPTQCAACGGKLSLLAEIPPRDAAHAADAPRVAYFRCERCAQIRIVEP